MLAINLAIYYKIADTIIKAAVFSAFATTMTTLVFN